MDAEHTFFEGTEKLLEIWFNSSDRKQASQHGQELDLRRISKYIPIKSYYSANHINLLPIVVTNW